MGEPNAGVGRACDPGAAGGRRGRTVSGRLVVIVVLLAGALTGAVICWAAFANRESQKPMMAEPEVGAGAGHTGMYNEYGGVGKKR